MILFKEVVAADQKYTFANQPNCVIFDVHNDSPFNMGVSFGRDTGVDNADYFTSPHSVLTGIGPGNRVPSVNSVRWTGTVYIYTETPLGTGSTDLNTAPAFQITVIGYPTGYQPTGTTSLARMTATPNAVNTNVNSTSAILNTGNAPGTNIINVQPSDAASATWTADNSGNLTIKSDNAGTLITLLQLIAGASPTVKIAAATIIAEILGGLKVDGTLESVGNATMDGTILVKGSSSLDNGKITTDGAGNLSFSAGGLLSLSGLSVFGNTTFHAGTTVTMDGTLNFALPAVQALGSISGSIDLYQYFQGTIKRCLIVWNAYNAGTTNPLVTLPTAFTKGANIITGNIGAMNIQCQNSLNAVLNVNVLTGLAAGGGSVTNQAGINKYSIGEVIGAIAFLNYVGRGAGPITGFALIEGE